MALLSVQHTVRDYPAWRAVFHGMDELRQGRGVTVEAARQLADDPNTVLVQLEFATVAQARGFLTSREHRAAMKRGGVEGTPRVAVYA